MPSRLSDLRVQIEGDLARFREPALRVLLREPQVRWLVRYRLTTWWCTQHRGVLALLLKWRLQKASVRMGFSIPLGVLGPALRLPHYGTIAINGAARVGAYCQILPGVTIGGDDRGAPTLQDHVYVGPGVQVIGDVTVGRSAFLAPGAVVVTDVPAGELWGGVPARRLNRSSRGATGASG